jgi:hypothetical protein
MSGRAPRGVVARNPLHCATAHAATMATIASTTRITKTSTQFTQLAKYAARCVLLPTMRLNLTSQWSGLLTLAGFLKLMRATGQGILLDSAHRRGLSIDRGPCHTATKLWIGHTVGPSCSVLNAMHHDGCASVSASSITVLSAV